MEFKITIKPKNIFLFITIMCFITLIFENKDRLLVRNRIIKSSSFHHDQLANDNNKMMLNLEKRKRHPLKNLQDDSLYLREHDPKSALLVNTSNCKIIRWQTFDPEVIPLYTNHSHHILYCKKSKHFHNISIERTNFNGIKIINALNKTIECLAQRVERRDDFDLELSQPMVLDIDRETHFPIDVAVKVNCSIEEDNDQLVKVLALVPEPEPRQTDPDQPNVLIIGIDSVSRLNFDRHFTRTSKLLSKHNFYTMYGYNKVGDNTFPNLTPLLTGFYPEDIYVENVKSHFDHFPFIWNGYRRKGYQTYYLEDSPWMNTFNYMKKGFDQIPTDYYLRTFCMAMDKEITNSCYLDTPTPKVYFDYLADFIRAMSARAQKYFAFHFMASLTHDNINNAGVMDPFVYRFLDKMFEENLLNDTIVIFFSDHGIRFGKIRETLSGKYEERLPFMHIYVPKEWRNRNLTVNQHRLTSPFDIHATLKHILHGVKDNGKYGKSLFEEIPEDRSCKSIPISDHWCGCQTSRVINNLRSMKPFSEFIVQKANQLLSSLSDKCAQLWLNGTLSATEQTLSDKVLSFKKCKTNSDLCLDSGVFSNHSNVESTTKHYMITVRVSPSDALLEATVNYDVISGNMTLIGDISRINLYGNQSHCIESAFLKKYCFCKDFIQNNKLN